MPEIPMGPTMSMKMVFSDVINGNTLNIPGYFKTPVFNTAIFHQSTFNDLFGAEGLSFTVGLRMDYENLKMNYNSGVNYTHTYSLSGDMGSRKITMIPETEFSQNVKYEGDLGHDYIQLLPKFAIQYDFNNNNNIYATVSKGYRSGGYNIQMFSDILQNDMKSNNMSDVAKKTIETLDKMPTGMISEEMKQKIIGMMNGMAQKVETDVKSTTLYKPEYSWNYEIGSHMTMLFHDLQQAAWDV